MYDNKKIRVIVVAAGTGKRFGSRLPKQFAEVNGVGKTVLEKSIEAFENLQMVDEILVVTNQDFLMLTHKLCEPFLKVSAVIPGGKERQDSVYNAILHMNAGKCEYEGKLNPEQDIILVHDGARPFATENLIERVIIAASEFGAAVPAVPVKDTIRQRTHEKTVSLDRSTLYSVQTPQGFRGNLLREAYERAYEESFYGTDDAMLVEHLGKGVEIVEGDYANYKITTPEDLPRKKEEPMDGDEKKIMDIRAGTGYDVHQLVEGRKLYLCGVEIPHGKGLLGHSDADVAIHALMDALLGAAAMGDIGKHFPDSDEQYKGISSVKLLEKVGLLLEKENYSIGNVDITIIAQKPKIAQYISTMEYIIAKTLKIQGNRVNVKATTTEKLGFAGREEGIAAEAVCILYRGEEK